MPYASESPDQLALNLLLEHAAREQKSNTLYQYQQSQRLQLPQQSQSSQQPQQSQHSKLSGAKIFFGDIDQKQALLYIV